MQLKFSIFDMAGFSSDWSSLHYKNRIPLDSQGTYNLYERFYALTESDHPQL